MLAKFFNTNINTTSEDEDITSSKYKDILTRSSGSLAVYQLRAKKDHVETLMKKTVGDKNLNKANKTILLVGETGAGKTTLINALVNYTMGVKFEDNIWFEVTEKEETQTSDVTVYEIFGFEGKTLPYSLTIIDTPGYGNTRVIEHDLISQRLLDLFHSVDGVHEINAVGLVMKASDNRLTDRLRYVFNLVTSLFGKNMEKNIVALITYSDGRRPENVLQALEDTKIKCAKNEKNEPVHFLFDNCQSTERTDETEPGLQNAWSVTVRGMCGFAAFLERSTPQQLMTTVKVLKTRVGHTACIQNLQDRINLVELKQEEIKLIQEALKKHEQEMKMNEKFTVEVDEVYKEKEPIDSGMWFMFYQGALCCTVCEENCHYPGCTIAWSPGHCKVMKKGCCTVCTNKCPASDHVKKTWRFVTKTRKVQKTETEMKEKYEENKAEGEKKVKLLDSLEKEMKTLEAGKQQVLEDTYQHVLRLEEIALNVDSLSTYVHLDLLIELMKEKGDAEKVQKLEEMKSRVDEGTREGMQYMLAKVKKICY